MNTILVLCEGNICRSPMAEALLRAGLPKDVRVSSGGLRAVIGAPAEPTAVRLLKERGLDISAHRARQINRQICTESELILVMERDQKRLLEGGYPSVRGRTFLIAENDVADPFHRGEDAFRIAFAQIEAGARQWISRLAELRKRAYD